MDAGPPSGNTTVPYKDSRLLPSHAPSAVTARFGSLPSSSPRLPLSYSSFFPLFFLRMNAASGQFEMIETARGMIVSISVCLYVNNCRV